jgi:hypothetical protein
MRKIISGFPFDRVQIIQPVEATGFSGLLNFQPEVFTNP